MDPNSVDILILDITSKFLNVENETKERRPQVYEIQKHI